eukprot:TRINITY_DN22074_c0_g1_i2.p1 TRINITY_DN22074_c0_g1~~TRINITY_DN22074_c0_g1_i2.p1  ORF type:complete len:117 (-),score=22.95 TRINITY_DN22074_c0_g1_i2:59-409(-)
MCIRDRNEQLSKNSITLSRKMNDLAFKLKKSDPKNGKSAIGLATPKLSSLNEQRLNKKRKLLNETSHLKNCTLTAVNQSMNQIKCENSTKTSINSLATAISTIEQRSSSIIKMPNS